MVDTGLRVIGAPAIISCRWGVRAGANALRNIDAFAVWEPWPTRTLMAVKGSKILATAEGIYNNINFIYMNRGWIEKNYGQRVNA